MRQSIHHHYALLSRAETAFVDEVFSAANLWSLAKSHNVPLNGDDTIERAVDALARAVIESRPARTVEQFARMTPDKLPSTAAMDDALIDDHIANKWTHG